MHEPALSVVVPVFNGRRFLPATLSSLARLQEAVSCEIIFQNNLSSDGTGELLDEFCRERPWCRHYNEPDSGQSAAINAGMARARGRWLTWLCADDLLLPGVADVLAEGERAGADLVYGDVIFLQDERIFPAEGTEAHRPGVLARRRLVIQQPGTCIRRDVWTDAGGVRPDCNWAMDYDLFLRLEAEDRLLHRVPRFVAAIRLHPLAKTSSGSVQRLWELWSMVGRSHRRRPGWFRLRPYLVYGLEFVIKFLEARRAGGANFPPRAVTALLHRLFWLLAQAREAGEIRQRFAELPSELRHLLAMWTKSTDEEKSAPC